MGQAVFERQAQSYLGENVVALREKDYSEATAREIDLAIKSLIDEAYERAKEVLNRRRKDLDAGTRLLLDRETITPEDFPALLPEVTRQAAE